MENTNKKPEKLVFKKTQEEKEQLKKAKSEYKEFLRKNVNKT